MKNVVMGTAGHIDHGKTALVKRLTGIDTDRLEEEKRRGMTIDLGFAPMTLPSGKVISIIDVPGHEKFVKTMVAGVTGIDFVMLVVAADEGVMPQTREHIDILSLLNVKMGVVALTKCDLVDAEWLQLASEDITNALSGTPLEGISVIPVSSFTGEGIDKLIEKLEQLSQKAQESTGQELFRLPVDRVFTMQGHGTVITGTVSGGSVSKGNVVEILPKGLTARVRGIQVHNRNVDIAASGERCALNLTGIEKEDLRRGDVVAEAGILKPAGILDAVVNAVKSKDGIKHNQRVHVHIGTKEVLSRVRIIGAEEIPGGRSGYVQLKLEEPIAVLRGDRFIIRSYSPVDTIGGGRILFHDTRNRPRFSEDSLKALEIGEKGSLKDLVSFLLRISDKPMSTDEIWRLLISDKNEINDILNSELENGNILKLQDTGKYIGKGLYNAYADKVNMEFELFYKKYPYRFHIDREEIKSKVFRQLDSKDFAEIINQFVRDHLFVMDGNNIIQPNGFAINKISAKEEVKLTEKAILEDGLNVRNTAQLKEILNIDENKLSEIERFLIQTGRIIDLGDNILVHYETLKSTVIKIRSFLDTNGSAAAAQIRDYLGIGRKIAIALLEYLDRIEVTERVENNRKPGVHYMDFYI